MHKINNYIGILRIYSLVDLFLLLVAIKSNYYQFIGAILLHVGFLFYLEYKHDHSYRMKIPGLLWQIFIIFGLFFYNRVEGLLYVLVSFLYTKKTKKLGFLSPFMRGLQFFFIVGGITNFHSYLPYLAGILGFLRNLAGDFRDAGKDKKESMRTLPVIFGLNKNIKYVHLFALFLTTFVWWYVSGISIYWLMLIFLVEIGTYNLTPR